MGDINKRDERLGATNINNQGYVMTIVEYNTNNNIIIEFNDEERTRVKSRWDRFKSGNVKNPSAYKQRLNSTKKNNQGYIMKVVEYNGVGNIVVEFQDEYKERVRCTWQQFESGSLTNPSLSKKRIGEERVNKQGDLMKIIEYKSSSDIIVEFQDDYKAKVSTTYGNFNKETIVNPYHPTIYGVGMKGAKYPASYINKSGKTVGTKEYYVFRSMITRCYSDNYHKQQPTYKNVTCCKEWHNRDVFEDWLRSQPNYEKFLNGDFALDKDILVRDNKIYSPETCCLVPRRVNELFKKDWAEDNDMPIGARKKNGKYIVYCCVNGENTYVGTYEDKQEASMAYKNFKEKYIKQVAQEEFDAGNITEKCYNAMINYEVEIID